MIKYSELYQKELDRRHDEIVELNNIAGKVAQSLLRQFEQKFDIFYPSLEVEITIDYKLYYPEDCDNIFKTKEMVNKMVVNIIRELGYRCWHSIMYNTNITTFKIWGDKLS